MAPVFAIITKADVTRTTTESIHKRGALGAFWRARCRGRAVASVVIIVAAETRCNHCCETKDMKNNPAMQAYMNEVHGGLATPLAMDA